VVETFKPSPSKVHYVFTQRDLFKVLNGLIMIESSYLKDQMSMAKLLVHECMRVFSDKVVVKEDKDQLVEKLKDTAFKNFDLLTGLKNPVAGINASTAIKQIRGRQSILIKSVPQIKPENLMFSMFNPEVEGYYSEIEDMSQV